LLHKPPGFDAVAELTEANKKIKPAQQLLQPATHATDDPSGTRVLKRHFAKLTATVPLETGASGLVVFTQDWRVLRKLEEDAGVIEQEVIVEVAGEVAPGILRRLNQGLDSERQTLPPVKVSLNSTSDTSSKLRFALKGVHPGLIAFLCERVGLEVVSMKRLRIGRVSMTQLLPGQWRYLQAHERF
jgi:23S rRNA pseudouridine2604 synthase